MESEPRVDISEPEMNAAACCWRCMYLPPRACWPWEITGQSGMAMDALAEFDCPITGQSGMGGSVSSSRLLPTSTLLSLIDSADLQAGKPTASHDGHIITN
eukprot:scaffold91000_cov30-Prasinocladus_malaysianus.AAC.1